MDALILSCSTGGGHNAAGRAVKAALEGRGHRVTMLDPYTLVGNNLDDRVGSTYIRMAQKAPHLFGAVYRLGDLYRQLPVHSPVYGVNLAMVSTMERYLSSHHYDVILMPHIYPGEILTCMKNRGIQIPKTIFIATDYVCIPFTEEIQCDRYVIPSPELDVDFIRRGIDHKRLVPLGIPVGQGFETPPDKQEARARLWLRQDMRHILFTGGSIGAGEMERGAEILDRYLKDHPDCFLTAICGSNQTLHQHLQQLWGENDQVRLLKSTDQMSLYMRACDVFLSKPGGLSSTEAAVLGTCLIHLSPIPGCEQRNLKFFDSHGMCLAVGEELDRLPAALELTRDPQVASRLVENQQAVIPRGAAERICDLAEELAAEETLCS